MDELTDSQFLNINREDIPEDTWCPDCQSPPEDERRCHATVKYCNEHRPSEKGSFGDVDFTQAYWYSAADAGGLDNKAVCDFFHRGRKDPEE